MTSVQAAAKPIRAMGGFFAMTIDTFIAVFRSPLAWREYIIQSWFVARVSVLPALMLTMPYSVLLVFTFNILLTEFGATDFAGTGSAIGTVNQIGPIVTVLVVSGAGATAMCADLGARTIREEIDAMRVLGIDPVHRLVVPRVLASTFVALLLNGLVCAIGIAGGYVFSVFLQGVNPGAFINGLTVLTGLPELVLAEIKALLFGVVAGLVGCGKSELARAIFGLETVTGGSIRIESESGTARVAGHDVFREPDEVRRRIGYMPENNPLHRDMRVKEYLKFRASLKGLSRSQRNERVDTTAFWRRA